MAGESSDLEFNGPFPDWWNVVDDFGADPTGTLNSTGAFQDMINAMVPGDLKNGTYNGVTGYLPSGTYLIGSLRESIRRFAVYLGLPQGCRPGRPARSFQDPGAPH